MTKPTLFRNSRRLSSVSPSPVCVNALIVIVAMEGGGNGRTPPR